jgi:FtsH-binding integral membrane protein
MGIYSYTKINQQDSVALYNKLYLQVYRNMGFAVVWTFLVGYTLSCFPSVMQVLFGTSLRWIVTFAPCILGYLLVAKMAIASSKQQPASSLQSWVLFLIYSATVGVSSSILFYMLPFENILRAFLSASGVFFGMALYGITTSRPLGGLLSYVFAISWGFLIMSLANMFLRNSQMSFISSFLGIGITCFYIAYEMQMLKIIVKNDRYMNQMNMNNYSIWFSVMFYMNFMALFFYMIRLFNRRED